MSDRLVTGGVASGTWLTSLIVNKIDMIPEGIGKLACLMGIIGTMVAVAATLIKSRYDAKKSMLEIKKLKIEIEKNEAD